MLDILFFGLIVGCFAWWLITLADKRRWLEWLQINAPNDTIHTLFSCHYCMSWWTSLGVSLVVCIVSGEWQLMAGVFVATLISVKMLG